MALPGPEGGWNGQVVPWDEIHKTSLELSPVPQPSVESAHALACQDLSAVIGRLRVLKLQKWSLNGRFLVKCGDSWWPLINSIVVDVLELVTMFGCPTQISSNVCSRFCFQFLYAIAHVE